MKTCGVFHYNSTNAVYPRLEFSTKMIKQHMYRAGVSNTWHATALKVARELSPYFINMLQCNFKYRYSPLLQYRTNKIGFWFSQFLLVYPDSRHMRSETEISAKPQTGFASATKFDLL